MNHSQVKLGIIPDRTAPAWDENLRLWLVDFLKETGMSTNEFARHAGGSRTLYDEYISCKYLDKLKNSGGSKVETLIRAYRNRLEGPNAENRSEFVKTAAWHQIRTAIATAVEEHSITIAEPKSVV